MKAKEFEELKKNLMPEQFAYGDCLNQVFGLTDKQDKELCAKRNLDFKGIYFEFPEFKNRVYSSVRTYNNFDVINILKKIESFDVGGNMYAFAREGSPAIYMNVHIVDVENIFNLFKNDADEIGIVDIEKEKNLWGNWFSKESIVNFLRLRNEIEVDIRLWWD